MKRLMRGSAYDQASESALNHMPSFWMKMPRQRAAKSIAADMVHGQVIKLSE